MRCKYSSLLIVNNISWNMSIIWKTMHLTQHLNLFVDHIADNFLIAKSVVMMTWKKKHVQYSIVEIHVYITFELTVETTKLFVYLNVLSILLWFWMVLQPIHWPNQCTTILSADCFSIVVSTRFSLIFHFVFKSYKVTLNRFNIKCYQFNIKKNNWRILQHKMSETLPCIVCVFKWFYSFIVFPLTPLKKEPFFFIF